MSAQTPPPPTATNTAPAETAIGPSSEQLISKGRNTETPSKLGRRPFLSQTLANLLKSTFVMALALFVAIDTMVRINFHPNSFDLPEHNQIWWTVNGFKELDHVPDILIFGSSLVLSVTNDGDAAYLQRPVDSALHHSSICLEENLTHKLHTPVRSYSFAVGGQMASDVWAIEKTLVDAHHRPRLVVWGIAPRDLVDSAFDGPYSSDTARYMNKISHLQVIPPEHRSLPGYIEKMLGCLSYLFQERMDLVCLKQDGLRALRKCVRAQVSIPILRRPIASRLDAASDVEVGDWITPVCSAYSDSIRDNSAEYRTRYNPFKLKTFIEQASYLEKFLSLNREFGTKVVLVNMPLTPDNMQLMPPGLYDSYLAEIKHLANKYNAEVLDFNSEALFSRKEFSDTAHLNGLGGEKLAQLLCEQLGRYWQANNLHPVNYHVANKP